jgi:hypothetical protein
MSSGLEGSGLLVVVVVVVVKGVGVSTIGDGTTPEVSLAFRGFLVLLLLPEACCSL